MHVKSKPYSMRYRAMVIIVIVMVFFFATAGWALYKAFEKSVEQSAKNTLEAYAVSLLSTMDFNNQDEVIFESLPLPQLAQPNSGVYAEIWNNNLLLWQSDSLIGKSLPRLPAKMSKYQFYPNQLTAMGLNNMLTLGVDWQEESEDKQFEVLVSIDTLPYQQRLRGYAKTLLTWLLLIGALLLLLQLVFFSFLFRPLSRVVGQLNEVESGDRRIFDDEYPEEVLVLTKSLNAYIEHEKNQIKKQKMGFANLAHSLKTPLAVIRGALSGTPVDISTAEQQLDVMSQSIEYQLNKASSLSRQRYLKPIQCLPSAESIVSALKKLSGEKGVQVLMDVEPDAVFFGDEGDFLEVVGNLLENACKWCDQYVFLFIRNINVLNDTNRKRIQITVLDDGLGIKESERELIVQRGKRLDEKVKGHGIGLSIVNDIVESYAGTLEFMDAKNQYVINDKEFVLASGLKVLVVI